MQKELGCGKYRFVKVSSSFHGVARVCKHMGNRFQDYILVFFSIEVIRSGLLSYIRDFFVICNKSLTLFSTLFFRFEFLPSEHNQD